MKIGNSLLARLLDQRSVLAMSGVGVGSRSLETCTKVFEYLSYKSIMQRGA